MAEEEIEFQMMSSLDRDLVAAAEVKKELEEKELKEALEFEFRQAVADLVIAFNSGSGGSLEIIILINNLKYFKRKKTCGKHSRESRQPRCASWANFAIFSPRPRKIALLSLI